MNKELQNTEDFILNKTLQEDSFLIKELELSKLLLMNDSNYPWFILVPRVYNITEIFELTLEQQENLCKETIQLSKFIKHKFEADKINIGALGNVVSQLHIHIIARYENDIVFPLPVWGQGKVKKYSSTSVNKIKDIFAKFSVL